MKNYILALFLILTIYGCNGGDENTIKAPGMVEGEIITMKSRILSSVIKISVAEGDRIEAGQELVRFDARATNNKIKDVDLNLQGIELKFQKLIQKKKLANENHNYMERQVARFERLSKKRSVSGDDLEKMKLKLLESETIAFEIKKSLEELDIQKNVLENKKEYLGLMLENYTLNSGVTGVVMEKFISKGENVFPGTPIIDILDKDSLFIEIFIEEKELFAIKIGSDVKINVDGAEDIKLKGVVSELGMKAEFSPKYVISEVERKSLLYKVKIRVSENRDIFKIGMPVTVIINKNL